MTLYHLKNDRVEFTFNMRTNFLLGFLLVLGTIQAHPSNGRQRFARQAPEEEATLESKPEMKDDMPAEVEVENIALDDVVSTEYDNEIEETEIEIEIKDEMVKDDMEKDVMEQDAMEKDDMTKDVMMKDDMLEADTVEAVAVNEVQDNKVQVKVEASTTTTKAPKRVAPLGVTLRAATTTTRRTTTTQRPTTKRPDQPADPGLLARIGNLISGSVNGLAASTVGGNLISGGSLLAAAASPLWAPLLVGKKRRRRGASETDVSLNEIDQARLMQYYNKPIWSRIKQRQNYYW